MLKTNVLILGKSGAGKSALLNLLWGSDIAQSAAGRPVTPKETNQGCGIYPFPPINKNGIEIIIHDSWGMESDKANAWSDLINTQIKKSNASSNVGDWFHTIIYCISAKGARIEGFEIKSIIRPLIEQGNSIVFALTKSDIASDNEYQGVENIIKKEFPDAKIVKICSVSQTLRNGNCTETFGSEDLSKEIIYNLRSNLVHKIKINFLTYCTQSSEDWKSSVLDFYDKKSSFFKTRSSLHEEVAAHARVKSESMQKFVEQWLVAAINDSQIIFNSFGMSFSGIKFINEQIKNNDNLEFKTDHIKWDGGDFAAHIIINLIPLVNILYAIVADDMYRDKLKENLDFEAEKFNHRIASSLKKIDEYLLQRLLIK